MDSSKLSVFPFLSENFIYVQFWFQISQHKAEYNLLLSMFLYGDLLILWNLDWIQHYPHKCFPRLSKFVQINFFFYFFLIWFFLVNQNVIGWKRDYLWLKIALLWNMDHLLYCYNVTCHQKLKYYLDINLYLQFTRLYYSQLFTVQWIRL